jgi:DNA repair protein RecO (recombination protein O)
MFVHYRSLGIILKKENRRDADQLLTILTKEFGKVKVLAKAIRKIKSKLRSGVQIFSLSEIEFVQGKTYKTLTDSFQKKRFVNINKDLDKLKIATEIGENVDFLIRGDEAGKKVWLLVLETLDRLEESSSPEFSSLAYHYFFWNFLSFLGYRPELDNCSFCQKKIIPENLYFNSEQGGIICDKCFKELKEGKRIDSETTKILRFLMKEEWDDLKRLNINQKHKENLEEISGAYISYFKDVLKTV